MLLKLLLVLLLAPVPADRPPDPAAPGFLGVGPADSDATGLTVGTVQPGEAADRAGVRPGDVLVRVGATAPADFDAVSLLVYATRPGTRLTLEVRRGGKVVALPVVVGARPPAARLPRFLEATPGRPDRIPPFPRP